MCGAVFLCALAKGAVMNKRERVVAAIKGEKVDGLPSCYSLHFPAEEATGPAGVAAHLRFFEETDTDVIKIMNEHLVRNTKLLRTPSEFCARVEELLESGTYAEDQIEFTRQILAQAEPDAYALGTLHGVIATSLHVLGKMGEGFNLGERMQIVTDFCRWDAPAMHEAFGRIADYMADLAAAYVRDGGVDGVFYASLGAETKWLQDDEFATFVAPCEKRILSAIREAGGHTFLHMCKSRINMERFRSYAPYADVVNWGVYEVPFSMAAGRELFPGITVLGGLENRSGAIASGDPEQARAAVRELVAREGREGLIVGADCTLATDQDRAVVRAAVEEARSL